MILKEDDTIVITLNGVEAHHARAAVRAVLLKRTRELQSSTFIPAPGKRHAGEEKVKHLTTALSKIHAAIKDAVGEEYNA